MDQNPPQCQARISGKDRISELSDGIICEILSRLPTKDAVATTILSKRWKGQWTFCFNLDFSDDYPLRFNPTFSLYEDTLEEDIETCFVNVKDLIQLNKSPCIKKFRFQSETMDESDVTECLHSILRRNVEEIELNVSLYQARPVILPQILFSCQTLVSLKIALDATCDIGIPPSVHLPSLKVFWVNLYDPSDVVTTKLFCDLPILEDLSVSIWLSDVEEMTLNIFTPSLKRLKLKLDTREVLYNLYDYQIVVRAPRIEKLDISNDIIANYMFEELPLDVKARLGVRMCTAEFEDEELAALAIQLMNGISGIKSLALSTCVLGNLDFGNVAVFPNVTCLEVNVTSSCCGFTYLPYLISGLPKLEVLVLEMVPANLAHVPQCLLLHLKRIEVKGFNGQEYELKLLGSLLKAAQVLDEVVIYTHSMALEERKNLCQKLSLFSHGSKNCQFKILENITED